MPGVFRLPMPASGLARDCQLPMPASGDPSVTMSSPRPTASPGSPVPNGQSPVSSLVEEPAPSPVPDRHLRRHVPPLAEESAPVTAVVPVSDDWRAGAARPRPTSKHWRLFHEHLAQDPAAKAAFDAIELQGRGKRGKEIDKQKVASLFTFMEENPDLFKVTSSVQVEKQGSSVLSKAGWMKRSWRSRSGSGAKRMPESSWPQAATRTKTASAATIGTQT